MAITISLVIMVCAASFYLGQKLLSEKIKSKEAISQKKKQQKTVDLTDKFARLRERLHLVKDIKPSNQDK